jgi:uncharacterized membrane protein
MKLLILIVLTLTIFAQLALPVHSAAQIGIKQPTTGGGIQVGKNDADTLLSTVIRNIITFVFTFASVALVLVFMWGSVDWIISGGDKDKVSAARKKITAAITGFIILSLSFFFISVIGVMFGINPFQGLKIPFLGEAATIGNPQRPTGGNVQ